MKEELNIFAKKAKEVISATAILVGDLNGDGKVDQEDAKIAAEWAKKNANALGEDAVKLGKEAMRSGMVKDAAAGAVVGAGIAIPVPVIGPLAGAAIGAGLGMYKNIIRKDSNTPRTIEAPKDVHGEILKFDDLREKGIISDSEFEIQKKKLLEGNKY